MTFLLSQNSLGLIQTSQQIYEMFGKNTPIILALLPSVIGVALFFFFKKKNMTNLKFIAYIPLLIGIVIGILGFLMLNDVTYMAAYAPGQKTVLAYRAVMILPIISAIALFAIDKISGRPIHSEL